MILSETSLVVGSPKIAFTCSFDAPSWILSKFSRASFEPDKAVEILELLQPVNPAAKRNRITNDERNCSRNIYFAITAFVFAPTWRSGFKEYCGDRTGIYSWFQAFERSFRKRPRSQFGPFSIPHPNRGRCGTIRNHWPARISNPIRDWR